MTPEQWDKVVAQARNDVETAGGSSEDLKAMLDAICALTVPKDEPKLDTDLAAEKTRRLQGHKADLEAELVKVNKELNPR